MLRCKARAQTNVKSGDVTETLHLYLDVNFLRRLGTGLMLLTATAVGPPAAEQLLSPGLLQPDGRLDGVRWVHRVPVALPAARLLCEARDRCQAKTCMDVRVHSP